MNNSYKHVGNIKGFIFLVGVFLVIGLLSYTSFLSRELRKDNREIVSLYAEIIAGAVNDDSNSNIDFIFENIIKKVKFPILQSDLKKIPSFGQTYQKKLKLIMTDYLSLNLWINLMSLFHWFIITKILTQLHLDICIMVIHI